MILNYITIYHVKSISIAYLDFFFVYIYKFFQLFGGLLIGVGLYAFIDKWQAMGQVKVMYTYVTTEIQFLLRN